MKHERTEPVESKPKHLRAERCEWRFAWSSRECGNPPNETGFCNDHDKKCSCGKQALGECESAGSFVCGYPTCDGASCHWHR